MQCHTRQAEAAAQSHLTLPNSVSTSHERALQFSSEGRSFFETIYNIRQHTQPEKWDAKPQIRRAAPRSIFSQQLCSKTLTCKFIYCEKFIKTMLVEGVQYTVQKTLRHWLAESHVTSLEDLTQKTQLLQALQGYMNRREQSTNTVKEPPTWRLYWGDMSRSDCVVSVENRHESLRKDKTPTVLRHTAHPRPQWAPSTSLVPWNLEKAI